VEGERPTRIEDSSVATHAIGDDATETLVVSADYAPVKRVDVLELDMGDGLVLYDPESRLVHHLNESASLLWQLAEGDASVGQLALEVSEELHLDTSEVHEQLTAVVAEMDALGLLDDAGR
jgi:hypothetical protein